MELGVILAAPLTSGETARVQISGNSAFDVARAVRFEHPCDYSTCNITASLRSGYPFVAAWLLQRRTETPLLDGVMAEYEITPGTLPDGLEDWEAFAPTISVKCHKCGAYTYDESKDWFSGRSCEGCGTELGVSRQVA
jgi:hypothetical protein